MRHHDANAIPLKSSKRKKITWALQYNDSMIWVFFPPQLLFTELCCNPALSNCSTVSKKYTLNEFFPPLYPRNGWNIKLNTKSNGVITAILWYAMEFKWDSLTDAETEWEDQQWEDCERDSWQWRLFLRITSPNWYGDSMLIKMEKLRWFVWRSCVIQSYITAGNTLSLSAVWDRHPVNVEWRWNAANHPTL